MAEMRTRLSPWIRRLIGLALLGVFVYWFARAAVGVWTDATATRIVPAAGPFAAALAANLLWLIALQACFGLALRRTVPDADRAGYARTAALFFRSHLARYVPGKVLQFGTMAAGLMRYGLSGQQAAGVIVAHEANVALGTGLVGLVLAPLFWLAGSRVVGAIVLAGFLGVLGVVAIWVARPPWARVIPERLLRRLGGEATGESAASARTRLSVLIVYAIVATAQAITIAPLVIDLVGWPGAIGWAAWLAVCLAYPVARLVGQMGMVIPGGLGVREGAFAVLVLSLVGGPAGAALAAWARIAGMISEGLVLGVYELLAGRERRPASADAQRPARSGTDDAGGGLA